MRNRQKSKDTPEGAEEEGARSRATDKSPETLPPLSLYRDPVGGEEAPSCPAHLKGGKKKRRKSQDAKHPKEFPCGEKPTAQVEQSLKDVKASYVLCKSAS